MGKKHRGSQNMAVIICLLVFLAADIVLATKLARQDGAGKNPPKEKEDIREETVENKKKNGITSSRGISVDSEDNRVKELLAGMSLEQKVAQMFMITPEALTGFTRVTAAGEVTKQCFMRYPVGGVIYMAGNLKEPKQTREMLANMEDYSMEFLGFPIFLGVDEEGGTVARIAKNKAFGVKDVGDMSEIGASFDCDRAYQAGTTVGAYLADLGFNLDFAPVADVWSNKKNTVVKYRSFGSDAELVRDMVTAQIEGLYGQGILSAVKHFPGHGSTTADSHKGAAVVEKTLKELRECDLIPFQGAVEAGVPFVMVGHLSLPQVVGDDVPAILSGEIITGILREELQFNGIVITDALDMGAVTDYYSSAQAAVMAVEAGADMLLMPEDFVAAYEGVLDAVRRGELTVERIDQSVQRILKVKVGMMLQE
ncbi:MAG: glycoside hydrolase family 3 protein [Lachnospiraceae bacterium]|nr:glycoside hydrolase family 3 protein [Lachnospiraceae bacterium]